MNARQIQKMLEIAREKFLPYEGVLGVGYGTKLTAGKDTGDPCLVVYVEKKLAPEDVKQDQFLPTRFEDVPVDVEEVAFDQNKTIRDNAGFREGGGMTEYLDWGKIHRLNMEQKERQGKARRIKRRKPDGGEEEILDFTSPTIDIRGDLFVIDDDGSLAYTTATGTKILDMVGAWDLFRNSFGDDYDFATFLLAHDTAWDDTGTPNVGNASNSIYIDANDGGYGLGAVNDRATWGNSTHLLRWVHHSWYSARTLLHEPGHQWLFFINYRNTQNGSEQGLLHEAWNWSTNQKPFHPGTWADNDWSCMDYDHDDWTEATAGTAGKYRIVPVDGTDDADFVFCPLDQYLMGLLNSEAISSSRVTPPTYPISGSNFQIINNPQANPDGTYSSTPITITAQNIIWNEGVRTPNHLSSQRVFHQAMIAITSNVSTYAAFLTAMEARRVAQMTNWRRATSGRSVMDTSLLRTNINAIYIRDNASDTGSQPVTGSFCNSPDIFIRNTDDDPTLYLNPALGDSMHQKPLSDQDNWIYARVHNKSASNYDNVTVRFYLANYVGFSGHDTVAAAVPRTEVMYPIDWHPDGFIGEMRLPTVPAGGTAVTKVRWPQNLIPPQADWHPCMLVEVFPLDTSPNKLHRVWDSRKLGQKNLSIIYVTPDRQDFTIPVEIGHPLDPYSFGVLEIQKVGRWPDMAVYLDPGEMLHNVVDVGGRLYAKITKPKLQQIEEQRYVKKLSTETTGGKRSSTAQLVSGKQRSILLPLKGFKLEKVKRKRMLRVMDPHCATLPVRLNRSKQLMKLRLFTSSKELKRNLSLQLLQHDGAGNIVGGIEVQLRCEDYSSFLDNYEKTSPPSPLL